MLSNELFERLMHFFRKIFGEDVKHQKSEADEGFAFLFLKYFKPKSILVVLPLSRNGR